MTVQRYLHRLRSLFFAALSRIVAVTTFAFVCFYQNWIYPISSDAYFAITAVLVGIIALSVLLSRKYYLKKLSLIQQITPRKKQLQHYQKNIFLRYLWIEIGGVAILAGFLLSGNQFYILFFILNILLVITTYPTPSRMAIELNYSKEEKEWIANNENQI